MQSSAWWWRGWGSDQSSNNQAQKQDYVLHPSIHRTHELLEHGCVCICVCYVLVLWIQGSNRMSRKSPVRAQH